MTVIPFPTERPRRKTDLSEGAVILVLPAIRIERYVDGIEGLVGAATAARRRRAVDLLRYAREGAPPPLDGRDGPV